MNGYITYLKFLLIAFFVSIIVGCNAAWTYLENKQVVTHQDAFKVSVPGGWVQYTFGNSQGVFVTKDGPQLQWVSAKRFTHQVAATNTDFELNKDILPSDLARFYEAKFKVENSTFSIENAQDTLKHIDGADGFEMYLDYKNERGLRYRSVVVGFVDDKYFYEITYQAPILYQFDLHLPVFHSFVDSFARI